MSWNHQIYCSEAIYLDWAVNVDLLLCVQVPLLFCRHVPHLGIQFKRSFQPPLTGFTRWFWPWFCTKATLDGIVVVSLLSVDTPNPTLASLPPLTRCFYVLPPLIHNGMSHAPKRPLSWVHFCVCVCVLMFLSKDHSAFFYIIFCQATRLMIMAIRL